MDRGVSYTVDSKRVMPMFVKLGLPGGIKRYLDDVLVCIGCANEEEVLRAMQFVRWVKTAYPPPLVLNVEPNGDQEFLEAKVPSDFLGLQCKVMNKVTADYVTARQPYRQRLASTVTMYRRMQHTLIDGIATRAFQYASSTKQMLHSLWELQLEMASVGIPQTIFHSVLHSLNHRYNTKNNETMIRLPSRKHFETGQD